MWTGSAQVDFGERPNEHIQMSHTFLCRILTREIPSLLARLNPLGRMNKELGVHMYLYKAGLCLWYEHIKFILQKSRAEPETRSHSLPR